MAKSMARFGSPKIKYRSRAHKVVRRAGSALARGARDEKHTLAALATAAALGIAARQGMAIPHLPVLGTAGTVGAVLWGIGRFSKSRVAQHAATGALAIAVFQLAAGQTISGAADLEDSYVEGEIPYDDEDGAA